jgi:uncharacterized protein with PIN domain
MRKGGGMSEETINFVRNYEKSDAAELVHVCSACGSELRSKDEKEAGDLAEKHAREVHDLIYDGAQIVERPWDN